MFTTELFDVSSASLFHPSCLFSPCCLLFPGVLNERKFGALLFSEL